MITCSGFALRVALCACVMSCTRQTRGEGVMEKCMDIAVGCVGEWVNGMINDPRKMETAERSLNEQ